MVVSRTDYDTPCFEFVCMCLGLCAHVCVCVCVCVCATVVCSTVGLYRFVCVYRQCVCFLLREEEAVFGAPNSSFFVVSLGPRAGSWPLPGPALVSRKHLVTRC